jgi:hypothetical protein
MHTFEESNCRFEFDTQHWWAIQYDTHKCHLTINMQAHKAIDILAVKGKSHLFLFEMKGFRNQKHSENKKRITTELPLEIAQKVRDSIAGIIGYNLNLDTYADQKENWQQIAHLLAKSNKNLNIIAWIEVDRTTSEHKTKADLLALQSKLKQNLSWLTTKVQVMNIDTCNLEGVTVSNLPVQPIV